MKKEKEREIVFFLLIISINNIWEKNYYFLFSCYFVHLEDHSDCNNSCDKKSTLLARGCLFLRRYIVSLV